MFKSIKEILGSFRVKISPEAEIVKEIKNFFGEKGIFIPGAMAVSFSGGVIKVIGDPYVSSYIKINNQEIVSFLKTKFPLYKIERVE